MGREELYAQTFDEIIRQCTIICAERGLLLLRVRDEIRMTIAAYQTLYESSIAFGMRQAQELKAKAEAIEKREGERRALEEKKHAEEVQFLKRTNAQLKKELEAYLQPTKK